MKLLLLLMFTTAASGLRSYANARLTAKAADSPMLARLILLMIDGTDESGFQSPSNPYYVSP